jgi:hypothetical protein
LFFYPLACALLLTISKRVYSQVFGVADVECVLWIAAVAAVAELILAFE